MYKSKTYRGEMKRYLRSTEIDKLLNIFLKEAPVDYLRILAIDYFSDPNLYTISELEELFNYEK